MDDKQIKKNIKVRCSHVNECIDKTCTCGKSHTKSKKCSKKCSIYPKARCISVKGE